MMIEELMKKIQCYQEYQVTTSTTTTTTTTNTNTNTNTGQNCCSGFANVILDVSVTYIDHKAFYGCNTLQTIIIPSTVTFIGKSSLIVTLTPFLPIT